ncbi:MAG: hypothetical protein F4035_07350 [Acidimicrobiia bacterium]|nr:hypothetical protein [Acidimicrobiia bacterium]
MNGTVGQYRHSGTKGTEIGKPRLADDQFGEGGRSRIGRRFIIQVDHQRRPLGGRQTQRGQGMQHRVDRTSDSQHAIAPVFA